MVDTVGKGLIVLAIAVLLIFTFFWLRAGRPRPTRRPRPPTPSQPPPVVGPDDDPDFLRDLNRRKRRDSEEDKPGD